MKSPENINLISAEQQERQEKFAELLDMMSSLPDGFKDSNDAYEVASFINEFKEKFEEAGLKLRDYLLGGVLLSSEDTSNVSNYPYYDTEDSKIEKFIRRLYEEQLNKNAA
jgi:hypothetical protein